MQGDTTVVGMYYEQEPIPYRFTLPGRTITLAQVRALNTKKGSYKYVIFFLSSSLLNSIYHVDFNHVFCELSAC